MGGFKNSSLQPHLNIVLALFGIGAFLGFPRGGIVTALLWGAGFVAGAALLFALVLGAAAWAGRKKPPGNP
ncbi:MAG: hypothetical protein AB7F75_08165 [Planctomycetota bacterium]